ncbi:hypothetical protein JTE90_029578 [Oedothorax gibbosus]|uniref:DET1- and DDB1-associated protein 1 n=1 Tax=Oedothorax gibbosus TaxID=931172 RepID=A0AAV6VDP6_9ARAC|nr:hypothetical protein JTE90_029578 [Oedothorax gibbosus]
MAGTEKVSKVKLNLGSNNVVPFSQLLDLRSAQSLIERAANESTADFLKGLPSHNESNFSRFQPDTSLKNSMRKGSVYLSTTDDEESQPITTDKTTILLRYLKQQHEKKKTKREDRNGTNNSEFTPRKKTRIEDDSD